ncbi:MAG: acylphosphatase [Candidatus Eisenbacteria bacterium]|uniref:Acylphosphatase n=1 Tax=Eiseniibacteriota bacterium TaxID=2212470 RepID=A0A956RRB0_UNCEI|nr:acylphosphatase [Candidatus Eisenbacteria bacterium]
MSPARQLRAIVTGRVQGVYFRGSTEERARALDLAGWVRNLPDGSVEVRAEGTESALEELLTFLHEGPPAARVTAVRSERLEDAPLSRPFSIRG